MPSLENLRKQAKLVLRWHRDGYYPVAAQIRTLLPRYRHPGDAEVLAHAFKLSDAQELVARQNGFQSWQALQARLRIAVHALQPLPFTFPPSAAATVMGAREPRFRARAGTFTGCVCRPRSPPTPPGKVPDSRRSRAASGNVRGGG